jgi:hypothetical protein
MTDQKPDNDYTPQEAQERFEAVLRAVLNTPPRRTPDPKQASPRAEAQRRRRARERRTAAG